MNWFDIVVLDCCFVWSFGPFGRGATNGRKEGRKVIQLVRRDEG